jgi:hypothetical protein
MGPSVSAPAIRPGRSRVATSGRPARVGSLPAARQVVRTAPGRGRVTA